MDRKLLSVPAIAVVTTLALGAGFAIGYNIPSPSGPASSITVAKKPAEVPRRRFKIPVSDSQPSLGPADALVTIVQWCDLPDDGCARMESALQTVRERDPTLVRLVFRHYHRPERALSMTAHQFVRAVFEQAGNDKFWQVRGRLLGMLVDPTLADFERIAAEVGSDWSAIKARMDSQTFASVVSGDRVFASMFEVADSNATFVNGRPLENPPTPKKLSRLVEEELRAAVKLVAQGVPQDEVYAELTKTGEWKVPNLRR